MKIGITYDLRDDYLAEGFSREATAEFDSIATIDAIDNTLSSLGYSTDRIGNARRLIARLAAGDRWDLVFNIAEGLHGFGREAQIPCILDVFNIPYTFSDPLVLSLSLHKGMTKHVLQNNGIPTPAFHVVNTVNDIDQVNLPFPLFAKPVAEGTSKGIDTRSIISSRGDLESVCRQLLAAFDQPVLVETYLSGTEFTVGMIGTGSKTAALGALEVIFSTQNPNEIYSLENKEHWEGKVSYRLITGALWEQARALAVKTWQILGCRDAGRVDLKADHHGILNVLEVNPLAGLRPEYSDLPILAELAGIGTGVAGKNNGFGIGSNKVIGRGMFEYDMNVLILFNEITDAANPDEKDVLDQVAAVRDALTLLQVHVYTLPFNLDLKTMRREILRIAPDLVFNLVESVEGADSLIHLAPSLLDSIKAPYTGCPADAIFITSNKILGKQWMRFNGVPTPPWVTQDTWDTATVPYPATYIIKSVWEHASIGLDSTSVLEITNSRQMQRVLLEQTGKRNAACFAELYIDGREFNMGVISGPDGPEMLAPAEIRFVDFPLGKPRIVDYAAKWDPSSVEYNSTVRSYDFSDSDTPLLIHMKTISRLCWDAFRLRGYARVDFRVDHLNNPWVLEINANPCISPDAGFAAALSQSRIPFVKAVERILYASLKPDVQSGQPSPLS